MSQLSETDLIELAADKTYQTSHATLPNFDAARIPDKLLGWVGWFPWKYGARDGGITKIPLCLNINHRARSDDPSTWAPFEAALRTWRDAPDQVAGLGVMLGTVDGQHGQLVGIDL